MNVKELNAEEATEIVKLAAGIAAVMESSGVGPNAYFSTTPALLAMTTTQETQEAAITEIFEYVRKNIATCRTALDELLRQQTGNEEQSKTDNEE
jgi:hypothetical protein